MDRSTIQRLGMTTKPFAAAAAASERLTISTSTDLDLAADPPQPLLELRPLVATVGVELAQERVEAEQRAHQQHPAVTVLYVGREHDGLHQQALRINQDVALLAADLLARVIARRIDAAPPFSAPFTLWLSMIAAVGLASRPANSRHCT